MLFYCKSAAGRARRIRKSRLALFLFRIIRCPPSHCLESCIRAIIRTFGGTLSDINGGSRWQGPGTLESSGPGRRRRSDQTRNSLPCFLLSSLPLLFVGRALTLSVQQVHTKTQTHTQSVGFLLQAGV